MPETSLLYLVRHGETEANREGRYAGWSDDRLNERGREQAAALAERRRDEGIAHLFTSPVRRCVETADILAGSWEASVRTVHDLHELEIGAWKGLTEAVVRERFPEDYREWWERPTEVRVDGRETLERVRERALRAVDQIGRARLSAGDAPAVVVTHLAIIRVLWLEARRRPLPEYHRIRGPHCRAFPIRWLGRGRLETAGPAPEGAETDGPRASEAGGEEGEGRGRA